MIGTQKRRVRYGDVCVNVRLFDIRLEMNDELSRLRERRELYYPLWYTW